MSHNIGRWVTVPAIRIGPDSGLPPVSPGVWEGSFTPQPALVGGDPLFVILHLTGIDLPGSSKIQVELGYGRDEFTSASGADVYTRPVDPAPGPIVIRYLGSGPTGGVSLGEYGSGEPWTTTYPSQPSHSSVTNADLFLHGNPYAEPQYHQTFYCPPSYDWQNVACVSPGSVEDLAGRAVCMLIMAHRHDGQLLLSSCSGTLIDTNWVVTARHCATELDEIDIRSGSVCFDFRTDCPGARPPGYGPMFYKIRRVVAAGGTPETWNQVTNGDWLVVEIDPVPVGIAPRPLRQLPGMASEPVFAIHHPNGAVKKYQAGALGNTPAQVQNFDFAGGSSGSALFDANGSVIGAALATGGQCWSTYTPARAILDVLGAPVVPPAPFDVMLVMDRSGSMTEPGTSGGTKMDEAKEAAKLFVQLVRPGAGDRLGMVSFSTTASASPDTPPGVVNNPQKHALVGTPPNYTGGTVGALSPGGLTSIGDGLRVAIQALTPPGANQRAILLMTDGMQNMPPMIEDIEGTLGNTKLFAVGFGNDAQLDSQLLSRVARDHGGLYTRANDGLELKKFFGLCFGNIFESGMLADPYFRLPAGSKRGSQLRFSVCDEDRITIIVGWENPSDRLEPVVVTPAGTVITPGAQGVVFDSGLTWAFVRIPLPHIGEASGTWRVHAARGKRSTGKASTRYFISVIPDGGPVLRALPSPERLYTGDQINPAVALHYKDGRAPHARLDVVVERPAASLGTLIAREGLKETKTGDDPDAAFAAAAKRLARRRRRSPLVPTDRVKLELFDDGIHADGAMERDGVYANPVDDLLRFEGTYTFHAVARYENGCPGRRETMWSVHVAPGIDPDKTKARFLGKIERRKGRNRGTIGLTPRDRYGSLLGPGRSGSFNLTPGKGTEIVGPVADLGDGTYSVPVESSTGGPSLVVAQPERNPVVIGPIVLTRKPSAPRARSRVKRKRA